jgi:hypothetical protein
VTAEATLIEFRYNFNNASTSGKSPGTVTLGFGVALGTSRTGWPINSHAAVSSVKINIFCRAAEMARRMTPTRKRLRRLHRPEPRTVQRPLNQFLPSEDSLMVSVTGCAATAAPDSARFELSPRSIPRSRRAGRRPEWPRFPIWAKAPPDRSRPSPAVPRRRRRCETAFENGYFAASSENCFLHPVADDQDDFVHALRVVEVFPSVGDDGAAGDLQPQLVRAHADATAGGDEDGGVHLKKLPLKF